MSEAEADRLEAGLRRSFDELFPLVDGALVEYRRGYRRLICPAVPFPGFNGVLVDGPDESTAVAELADAVAEVEATGMPCWVGVRGSRSPATEREARRLGFTNEDAAAGMVMRPEELRMGETGGPAIVVARDRSTLDDAVAVGAAGFEVPPQQFAALFTERVTAMPGLNVYVAYDQGQPVSTATSWLGDDGLGIFTVATPPELRRRGYGRAVTARAVLDGFAAGADLAWLQASPAGEAVYEAMGFRVVDRYVLFGR